MKSVFALLLTISAMVMAGCTSRPAGEKVSLNWTTNYEQAKAQAKAEGKRLLMDFTGSDWCPPCMRLDREVFSTQAFKDYADANLVLLQVDFPMDKEQTDEQKKANAALETEYGVEGYPTIIVLNSAGKKVGELNYLPGGPKSFIAALEGLKED